MLTNLTQIVGQISYWFTLIVIGIIDFARQSDLRAVSPAGFFGFFTDKLMFIWCVCFRDFLNNLSDLRRENRDCLALSGIFITPWDWRGAWDGCIASHNPEVGGSSPPSATRKQRFSLENRCFYNFFGGKQYGSKLGSGVDPYSDPNGEISQWTKEDAGTCLPRRIWIVLL